MMHYFDIAVRSVAALAGVYAFYLAAGTRWPTSYYVLDDVVGSRVSRTAWSFALFRFGPLFVASVCAMGYLPTLSSRFAVAVVIFLGHLLISVMRLNPLTNPGPSRPASWYVYQTIVLLFSALIVLISVWISPFLGNALPQWRDIVGAAITAMIAVLLGAVLVSSTSSARAVDPQAVDRSRKKFEPMVNRVALRHKIDRTFALAIVIAEDLQRPNWFRVIERRLARRGLAHTAGLAQVRGSFVTDEDGVGKLLSTLPSVIDGDNRLSRYMMAAAAEAVNEGDGYVEFFLGVYDVLQQGADGTRRPDIDGSPLCTASRPRLWHGQWHIEGDVGPSVTRLVIVNNNSGEYVLPTALPPTSQGGRTGWSVDLPLSWRDATLYTNVSQEEDSSVYLWTHI